MNYSTQSVATLYGVSKATIRNWAVEFAEYLSPTATPSRNKNRYFTVNDLEVLSLVAEQKKQGLTYTEIHAALKSGQRGQAPDIAPQDAQLLSASDTQRRLVLEVDLLQQTIVRLRTDLDIAQKRAQASDQLERENIRLQATLETNQAQLAQANEQLAQTRKQIEELLREGGQEYIRGFKEGLRYRDDEAGE